MEHTKNYEILYSSVLAEVDWYKKGGYTKIQLHTAITAICRNVAVRMAMYGEITTEEENMLTELCRMISKVIIDEH